MSVHIRKVCVRPFKSTEGNDVWQLCLYIVQLSGVSLSSARKTESWYRDEIFNSLNDRFNSY